jgi:predicted permease
MSAIRQDLFTALRMLRRGPGFAIAAILTLALGIGANTAIFSLIDAVLLEPLPYPHAERIVQLWLGNGLIFSIPEINLIGQSESGLEDFAAYDFGGPGVNITGSGEPEQVKAIHVSANYFRLFGARVEAGRTFTADEDRPNGGRVVVLRHAVWARRFGSDSRVIGSAVSLGNESYTVAGVLAADFQPDPPAEIWLPLQADPNATGQAHYLRAAGRLRNGITIDQANAALKIVTLEFRRRFPLFNPNIAFQARPLRETNAQSLRAALLVLFGTVVLVLLIACSNVSSLLLARAVGRRRELAIRSAIGASRGRLIAQLLTESLVLAIAGSVFGLMAGRVSLRALLAMNPDAISAEPTLDWRVLLFAIAIAVISTLAFGLAPALRSSRVGLAQAMQEGGARSGASYGAMKAKSFLVMIQVAMSVVLVIGAGLMIRTFAALREVKPGIDPHRVLTMQMSLQGTKFKTAADVARLAEDGVNRLKKVPGVIAAATTWTLPVENAFGSSIIIEGRPLNGEVTHGGVLMRPISSEFVSVFRIPVVRGRFFSDHEPASAAVISQAAAEKYWPGQDPIGERIIIDKYLGPDFAAPPREIIGIVGDVRDVAMNHEPEPIVYIPQSQVANGMTRIDIGVIPVTWAIRTAVEPYSLRAPIQEALRAASGGLPVARIRSMEEVIGRSTARSDFTAALLTAFAGAALLLAAGGVYGLIVFSVEQRRQEIGIRMALGAAPDRVLKMVVWQAMRLAFPGVALGLTASLAMARFMKSLLYGVKPVEPSVMVTGCAVLLIVAALAAYFPAYRASRMDAATVLKSG